MSTPVTLYCRAGGPRNPVWFCSYEGEVILRTATLGAFARAVVRRLLDFPRDTPVVFAVL